MRAVSLFIVLLFLILTFSFMVSAYEETRNLSVILEGEEELIIEAKSGYLQIQQVDDTDLITVEAVIRVDTV